MTFNCKRHHRLLQGLLMGLLGMASWIVQAAPNAYYIHNDHRGAPIVMTNANKTVVWQVAYKPYGEVVPIVSSADLDIRYPGQRQDDGTGLYYNHYRDYDPKLGRYVQSDPIGLRGGINTYAYANGNPIMNIDFFGLETCVLTSKGFLGFSNHSALYTSSGKGEIFDPSGGYGDLNGGEVIEGHNLQSFSDFHKKDGDNVEKQCKNTSDEQEKKIREEYAKGGTTRGPNCAWRLSQVLSNSGVFNGITRKRWPSDLAKDFKNATIKK